MLSGSLASFAKVFGRFLTSPCKIDMTFDRLPACSYFKFWNKFICPEGDSSFFPELTNKLIPIHSFLVKVLRKPIPSIHHIKIRHYIPQFGSSDLQKYFL